MGVVALVLGIISIIIGFIPLCGSIALVPAIIGLILGIVDVAVKSKKGESKGVSIAGVVLTAIAIVVILFWVFVFGAAVSQEMDNYNSQNRTYNSIFDNYEF